MKMLIVLLLVSLLTACASRPPVTPSNLCNVFTEKNLLTPSFGVGFQIKNQYELNYTFANYADIGAIPHAGCRR